MKNKSQEERIDFQDTKENKLKIRKLILQGKYASITDFMRQAVARELLRNK